MRLPLPFPIPFTRIFGPGLTVVGVLAIAFLLVTGRLDLSKLPEWASSGDDPLADVIDAPPPAIKLENRITIGTFDIQDFGEKKSGNAEVMAEIARICKLFDVVAIQEACSPSAEPVPKLVELMNRDGSKYAAIVSPPIGRTSQKEQYAFVWDTTRMRLEPYRAYVMNDEAPDRMHREPFVASFRAIPTGEEPRAPFSFTLINVHTDPDEVSASAAAENELDVLADIYEIVREWESSHHGEDDVILLGDLNSSADRLYKLGAIPGIASLTVGRPTNTAGTNELDHILINTTTTGEFTRQVAVLDYQKDLGLSKEMAQDISDHRPVCAQFSAFEMPPYDPTLAAAPSDSVR